MITSSNLTIQLENFQKSSDEHFAREDAAFRDKLEQLDRSNRERVERMEASTIMQITAINQGNAERAAALWSRMNSYEERMAKIDSKAAETAERQANQAASGAEKSNQRDHQFETIETRITTLQADVNASKVVDAQTLGKLDHVIDMLAQVQQQRFSPSPSPPPSERIIRR